MAGFSLFTDLITPTKYDVPNAPSINLDTLGKDTTAANATTFAGAKGLASDYNAFMRSQVQQALQQGVPGYQGITQQLSANLQSQLRGELTGSDLAATQRASAAQGLGLGLGGSQAGAALSARNIGLRQYQVQQNAQQQAPGYLNTMASLTRAPMFDPSTMFMSPMQRAQLSWQNQSAAWNVQNMRNQMAVQPDPWMKALAGFGDSLLTAAGSYFTMGTGNFSSPSSSGRGATNDFGGQWNTPYFNSGDAAAMRQFNLG